MQHALSTSLTHQVKRLINIKVIIEMITKGKVSFFQLTVWDSGFQAVESGFHVQGSGSLLVEMDFGF